LLGIVIGTLSSIYVSAAILIWLNVGPDSFVPAAADANAERVTKPEGFVN
jgi:preprotein translocase subunit SecF